METKMKCYVKCLMGAVIIELMTLLTGAILLETEFIAWRYREWFVFAALFMGSLCAVFLCVMQCGDAKEGLTCGSILVGLILFLGFCVDGLNIFCAAILIRILIMLIGILLGISLGKRRYCRLKNSRRRKKRTAK